MEDILLALCDFELHEFNELHFRFPVSGYGGRAVVNGTLTGAQESFQAWFREKVPRCTTFLAIGEAATATTALFAATESKVITIDTLPDTPMLKRQLWLKIKGLKG